MHTKNRIREQGFTLIEIIAVLVILGILAAVAVPKFMDMGEEAKKKTIQGACAAGSSQIIMTFSKALLENGGNVDAAIGNATSTTTLDTDLGDFTIETIAQNDSDGTITFNVTPKDSTAYTGIATNCTMPDPSKQ